MKSVVVACGGLFSGFNRSVKARRQKSPALRVELLEDRSLLSAHMLADMARKAPTTTGNQDGVHAVIASAGTGAIAAGETGVVAHVTLSASRSKYYFSGLQEELSGGGNKVATMALLKGGSALDSINPNGNGSSAFTGFSVGPISKSSGSLSFDVTMTAAMDADGAAVTVKFPQLSLRRGRKLIQLTGLLGDQNSAITVHVGTAPPVNPGNPGFTVTPSGGQFDPQEGSSDTGTIVLNQKPLGNVTIKATSTNTDITLGQASWTFTPDNWNVPQTITVNGLEDADTIDDTGTLTFSVDDPSSSNEYDAVLDQVFTALVHDNDTNPVQETARPLLTGDSTAIESGATKPLQLTLDKAPLTTMVVTVTSNSSNATIEGVTQFTFTPSNWNVAQTVTVRNASPLVVDSTATITATDSVGSSTATVALKGVTGGTGAHSVTRNVVSFIDLNNEDVAIQGITFQHTYANHAFYATFDTTGSGDSVTQIGDTHTTDANGAGITTFTPTTLVAGRHGEIRVVGTSDETFDAADNPVILVIKNGQVYRLQQGNGLTYSQGIWYMNLSQGIPN